MGRVGPRMTSTKRTNSGASSAKTFLLPALMLVLTVAMVSWMGASRNDAWKPVVGTMAWMMTAIRPRRCMRSSSASSTRSLTKGGTSSLRMLWPAVFDAQVAKVDQFTLGPPMVWPSSIDRS